MGSLDGIVVVDMVIVVRGIPMVEVLGVVAGIARMGWVRMDPVVLVRGLVDRVLLVLRVHLLVRMVDVLEVGMVDRLGNRGGIVGCGFQ